MPHDHRTDLPVSQSTDSLKSRLANFLFGDVISQATSHAVKHALAAISVRVDDGPDGLGLGWQPLAPIGPSALPAAYRQYMPLVVCRK